MKKIFILSLITLSLAACSLEQESSKPFESTFRYSETCQNQLKELVNKSFNLRKIPLSALVFDVEAETENEERIVIRAQKNEVTDAMPIGKFKVLKNEKQIFDSTFDETNLIEVDLKSHPDFIDTCFAKV